MKKIQQGIVLSVAVIFCSAFFTGCVQHGFAPETPLAVNGKFTLQILEVKLSRETQKKVSFWEPNVIMKNKEEIFTNPNADIYEYPLIRAALNKTMIYEGRTRQIVFPEKYNFVKDKFIYTTKEHKLGRKIKVLISKNDDSTVNLNLQLSKKELFGFSTKKLSDGIKAGFPIFTGYVLKKDLVLTCGIWYTIDGEKYMEKHFDDGKMIIARRYFCIRIIPPAGDKL